MLSDRPWESGGRHGGGSRHDTRTANLFKQGSSCLNGMEDMEILPKKVSACNIDLGGHVMHHSGSAFTFQAIDSLGKLNISALCTVHNGVLHLVGGRSRKEIRRNAADFVGVPECFVGSIIDMQGI